MIFVLSLLRHYKIDTRRRTNHWTRGKNSFSLKSCLSNLVLRVAGFCPRQFNRSAAICYATIRNLYLAKGENMFKKILFELR